MPMVPVACVSTRLLTAYKKPCYTSRVSTAGARAQGFLASPRAQSEREEKP